MAQCNMYFQLANLTLHISSHFFPQHRPVRDFVFTVLALPLSISCTVSFWVMWYAIGRDRVFPEDDTAMYPIWVVHGLHSFSPCVNLLLNRLISHNFCNDPFLFSRVFMGVYLYGACVMYLQTGSFRQAFVKKFTRLETAIYYFAFTLLSHICYACAYAYEDFFLANQDYEALVAARVKAAEEEVHAARSPVRRTPTPLLIIPRDTPPLRMPSTSEELTEDSPKVSIPSYYRPSPLHPSLTHSSGHSACKPSVERRRVDKKNN